MSLSHALSQYSVTRRQNVSSRARPARMSLRVPAPASQMRVPRGLTRPAQDSNSYKIRRYFPRLVSVEIKLCVVSLVDAV